MRFSLAEAVTLLGAELLMPGINGNADTDAGIPELATDASSGFSGLATDSRKPLTGNLFVALRGPNFDGHKFIAAAAAAGAAAALVERRVDVELPQLQVSDTLQAMGQLATAWRRRFNGQLIALTGSNGKTTTKEMLAAILAEAGTVMATDGNLNNEIGVPLTLARLAAQDFAIIEMGANHAGEIAYLSSLAQPQVALITNAGPAHLEGFGDLAGVACAKGEVYQGLGPDSTAVLNADDAFADYWRSLLAERKVIEFTAENNTDGHASVSLQGQIVPGESNDNDNDGGEVLHITFSATGEVVAVRLALPGRHSFYNALAAAAAAHAVGANGAQIKAGLEKIRPVAGRLQRCTGPFGSTLIDDTYNANPASLKAALEVLTARGRSSALPAGDSWLVLGDMAELGSGGRLMHREAGELARTLGVRRLYALGKLSQHSVRGFGEQARRFADMEALCEALLDDLKEQEASSLSSPPRVLVKGSRSMRMERVLSTLAEAVRAPSLSSPERSC